jgi:hypothetical protein
MHVQGGVGRLRGKKMVLMRKVVLKAHETNLRARTRGLLVYADPKVSWTREDAVATALALGCRSFPRESRAKNACPLRAHERTCGRSIAAFGRVYLARQR